MLTTAYSAAWQDVADEIESAEEEKESVADMDAAPMPESIDKATWFTPGRLLLLFSSINMMIYIDRGMPLFTVLSTVLCTVKRSLHSTVAATV